jgi:class 3 adenylate cyclase
MADDPTPASNTPTSELPSELRVFLFAEVRDYTAFSQEHGDEAATRLVAQFARLAREAVEPRGGRVIELRGDEALAVFGSAREALRAAVELQERFVDAMGRDPSPPLRVGIGLDAGEARPFEGGYRGRALNLAARLKDQARAGEVLATEALIHLAGQAEGLAYIERGLVHPKGFALPVRVVQVVAEGQTGSRGEQPGEPELRTFLFADIHAYMPNVAQQGDAAADLEAWYGRLAEERIRARGGRILDLQGDEAFAVFVSPREAIHAGIELQEQFQKGIAEERGLPLTLGVGVEAGEAIPTRGTYTGSVIYIANRVCSLAGPGEVLIGEAISRLVRKVEGLRFVDRGLVEIGRQVDPIRVVQVVREDIPIREH